MDSRLTDAELIQLVQEKLPEELSHGEIRQLHARLKESSELKAVLIGQLHLETYLNRALSEIDVSVEEIIRRADKMEQTKNLSRWPLWTGLAGLLLLAGVGVYFAVRPAPEPKQLAEDAAQDEPADKKSVGGTNAGGSQNKQNAEKAAPLAKNPNPAPPNNANPPEPPENLAEAGPKQPAWGKPGDPWFARSNPDKPPRPLTETAFEMPAFERGEMLQKDEANRWLAAAPGQSFQITNRENNQDRWVELGGVGKLRAPWVQDAVLRLSLYDTDHFRLHFWCGAEGVSLWHYHIRHPHEWAAYKARRKNNQPRPERLAALLTTDDGRQDRARSGTVEFRYQNGSLVMSEGNVRLLTVPLPGPPQEIIFDGKCMLSEIAMYRGESFPVSPKNPRPLVLPSTRPADLAWMTQVPGRDLRTGLRELGQVRESSDFWEETLAEAATFTAQDGKVRLAVEKSEQPIHAGTVFKRGGLYEIILRVEDASPGTGIYFGDDQGRELHRVSFHREKRTGQVVFDISQNQKNQLELDQDPDRLPVAYFANNHWLRVVWGFGCFKIWSSGDGVHWGTADSPARNLPGPCLSLGLMVQKTAEPRQITLSHLEIRELSAITTLASEIAREKAPAFGNLSNMDFGTWNQKVLQTWPLDDQANPSIEHGGLAAGVRDPLVGGIPVDAAFLDAAQGFDRRRPQVGAPVERTAAAAR